MDYIKLVEENVFLQYFISGLVGGLLFDLTLFLKLSYDQVDKSQNTKKAFLLFSFLYSGLAGGIMGLVLDTHWIIALVGGFFSSSFLVFIASLTIKNSFRSSFWLAILKLLFVSFGIPLKKVLIGLETILNDKIDDVTIQKKSIDKKRGVSRLFLVIISFVFLLWFIGLLVYPSILFLVLNLFFMFLLMFFTKYYFFQYNSFKFYGYFLISLFMFKVIITFLCINRLGAFSLLDDVAIESFFKACNNLYVSILFWSFALIGLVLINLDKKAKLS